MSSPESSVSSLDGDGVRAALQRILASDVFSNAPILSRFLSYLVQRQIAGNTTPPKEYTIGVDVFERGADFDPRVDTIVRVQARRLRKRLSRYYEGQGRADPVRITVPKGHYQVEVVASEADREVAEAPRIPPEPSTADSGALASGSRRRSLRHRWVAGFGVVVLVVLIGATYWRFGHRQGVDARAAAPAPALKASAGHAAPASPPAPVGLPTAAPIPRQSVAVLPFVNESGQSDQQFFSDGLSEDLINALSQFAGLKVINRDSAFQFRHTKETSAEVGKALGVAHLLEGSVQRVGNEVRITATLVDAANGSVVWSHRYDQPYADVFKLEDDITQAVTAALKTRLLAGDDAARQTDRPPGGNLAAYDAMLRGRFLADRGEQTDLRTAARDEERAVQLDPDYAYAWAELSRMREALATFLPAGKGEQPVLERAARRAASKALALAPDLAVAHMAQGLILLNFDWNLEGAERELQRAAQLAPDDAQVLTYLPIPLLYWGDLRQAAALWRRAAAVDPLSAGVEDNLADVLTAAHDLPAAQRAYVRAIALQPHAYSVHALLAVVQILQGHPAAAVATAKQETDPFWRAWALALAYWASGDRAKSNVELKRMVDRYADTDGSEIATIYAQRGQPDQAFHWLQHAVATRDAGVLGMRWDPFLARYRHDPRYVALARKLGLVDGRATSVPATAAVSSSSAGAP